MQGGVNPLYVVEHVPLGDKQIFPAVIVEVFETHAPARASTREHAQASFEAAITERTAAVVVINTVNLSGQFGHDNVWPTVVVIVLKDNSHTRQPPTVLRQSRSCFETQFGERSIPIVVKQILLHAVIGHKYICKSVLIVIGKCHA